MADVKPQPDNYPTVTAYLHVAGATKAIDFYTEVFGAVERMRLDAPDGRLGHAELTIGDSLVMLADEHPEMGVHAPSASDHATIVLTIYVDDVDSVVTRAAAAGATITHPVEDRFYGDRVGQIVDPFGHSWSVMTHIEDVSPEEMRVRAEAAATST